MGTDELQKSRMLTPIFSEQRWFVVARYLLLVVSIILSFVFAAIRPAGFSTLSIEIGLFLAALCIVDIFLERRFHNTPLIEGVKNLISASIITSVVYLTGGPVSPFVTLYLPLTMLIAVKSSQRTSLVFASICASFYGVLFWLLHENIIPPGDGMSRDVLVPGGSTLHLIGLNSALILVAVATNFLVRHATASHVRAEVSSRELEHLSTEREVLVKKLNDVEEQLQIQERMARLLTRTEIPSAEFQTKIEDFIGESKVMQQVFKLIGRVAPTEATTLISGESGTGKELVARAIHLGSKRAHKSFVVVNCGAIPEALIESELFGHKKGSFTGAIADHTGLFQEADGGTIFLDEIGELPIQMQAKLLRVLQEKTLRPIGGNRDIEIDVRIVAATNRNLKKEVEVSKFREDLYYRLNVISVHLPALRERKEDIPFLVNAILKTHLKDSPFPAVPPATMKYLIDYNYPGNVRELENILERALVLGGEAILPEHLPEFVVDKSIEPIKLPRKETLIIESADIKLPIQLDSILSALERRYLEIALTQTHGAKKKAAELLGMNFRSFRYRLQKFGISEEGLSE